MEFRNYQKILNEFKKDGWKEKDIVSKEDIKNYFLIEFLPSSNGLAVSKIRVCIEGVEGKAIFRGGAEEGFIKKEIARFEKELACAK